MASFKILSASEQAAGYLKQQLVAGAWGGMMPGAKKLSHELGVGEDTLRAALRALEMEGVLSGQGRRRQRKVAERTANMGSRVFRIRILLYEEDDRKIDYLLELQHRLQSLGHSTSFATKTLTNLRMDVKRVERYVRSHPADAWIVLAGSRDVLEWFLAQDFPAFALFGRIANLPMACCGPLKSPTLVGVVRHMVALGHRRIVMLAREERRKPEPGQLERLFLQELEKLGLSPSSYNLPDWENHPAGLRRVLDSLFAVTPPTTLIIQSAPLYFAVQQHLLRRGIRCPEQVSLICTDPDPYFRWQEPAVAHITWDHDASVRRIIRWIGNVAKGRTDRRLTAFSCTFVEGGTVGPAFISGSEDRVTMRSGSP